MISVLVLTHGDLAEELLRAAATIDPEISQGTAALALPWDVDSDQATRELKSLIRRLDDGDGVLIVTDMFGGTATNLALPFLEHGMVEVITGVNLPMLVKITSLRAQQIPLQEFAERLTEAAQKSIRVARAFLRKRIPTG